jgi:hypothetical protein
LQYLLQPERIDAFLHYFKERGNLQGAFKEHLSQVRTERHAQIERDQNSTSYPKSLGYHDGFYAGFFSAF